jgi:hypothetical protein
VKIIYAVFKLLSGLASCGEQHELVGTSHVEVVSESYATQAVGDVVQLQLQLHFIGEPGKQGLAACIKEAVDATTPAPP